MPSPGQRPENKYSIVFYVDGKRSLISNGKKFGVALNPNKERLSNGDENNNGTCDDNESLAVWMRMLATMMLTSTLTLQS